MFQLAAVVVKVLVSSICTNSLIVCIVQAHHLLLLIQPQFLAVHEEQVPLEASEQVIRRITNPLE
jgi:hypothetical protein